MDSTTEPNVKRNFEIVLEIDERMRQEQSREKSEEQCNRLEVMTTGNIKAFEEMIAQRKIPSKDRVVFDDDASNSQMENSMRIIQPFLGAVASQHKCGICDVSFLYKSLLQRHMISHTGERPFLCELCPKKFISNQNLRAHMKCHTEGFLYICRICLKGFICSDEKVKHEIDCKVRRYECHVCKKYTTVNVVDLKLHMSVHGGVKLYKCKNCFKQFGSSSNLRRHEQIHGPKKTNLAIFPCKICSKKYTRKSSVSRHIKLNHAHGSVIN